MGIGGMGMGKMGMNGKRKKQLKYLLLISKVQKSSHQLEAQYLEATTRICQLEFDVQNREVANIVESS